MYNIASQSNIYTIIITCEFHTANVRGIRFGYLDRTSNFTLKFDKGESVETIFPGLYKKHNNYSG